MISWDESDPHVMWMTGLDGWEHAIAEEEAARGMRTGDGRYDSLCCQSVVAAPLVAPLGRRCPSCVRLVARGSAPPQQEPRHEAASRRPFRRRLLRWLGYRWLGAI